ncbi:hypothetical protein NPIL_307521, partial [Nephila pilipes]
MSQRATVNDVEIRGPV